MMHLAVELRLADGSVADRQSLPIDWTLPPHAEVTGAKPEAVVAATPNMGATTGPRRGEELPVGAAAILTAPTPRLVLTASSLLGSDKDLPLGLSVQGGSDGMGITVGGLMAGTTVTAGRASGANGWWLGLADVDGANQASPRLRRNDASRRGAAFGRRFGSR